MGNLTNFEVSRQELEEAFSAAGPVQAAELYRDHAIIHYRKVQAAQRAVDTWNGGSLGNRVIKVTFLQEGSAGASARPRSGRGYAEEEATQTRGSRHDMATPQEEKLGYGASRGFGERRGGAASPRGSRNTGGRR